MGIVTAPLGGITAEIGGKTRTLLLRTGEIELFEERYDPLGLYDVIARFVQGQPSPQVRHCRDLVELGLIGGGLDASVVGKLVSAMGPEHNLFIKSIAHRLIMAPFAPTTEDDKPRPPASGDVETSPQADTTSPKESETS